jgi:hypothetical protein
VEGWAEWTIEALNKEGPSMLQPSLKPDTRSCGLNDSPQHRGAANNLYQMLGYRKAPMRTHRFGRKIKLPATIAIKHQIRMRMAQYEVKRAEVEARAEAFRDKLSEQSLVK